MHILSAASPTEAEHLLAARLRGVAKLRLGEAFRLSAAALADEPEEWPTQIVARLHDEGNPAIKRILKLIVESSEGFWLKPIRVPLIAAGGPIVEIIDTGGRTDDSRALAWSPDRKRVTSFSMTSFRTWDVASRREVGRVEVPIEWGRAAIAYSPQCAVVNAAQRRFFLVNLRTATAGAIPHEGVIEEVAISADGRWAVTSSVPSDWDYSIHDWSGQRTLRLFDLRKHCCARTWQAHRALIADLALSANGRLLATASFDQTARLFDLRRREMLGSWRSARRLNAVAITPDGRRIAYVSEGGVLTARSQNGTVLARISKCGTERGCLALSEDGRRAVMVAGGDVSVVDLRKSKRFGPFAGTQPDPTSLVIDGKARHAITGEMGPQLVLWNLTRAAKASPEQSWISGIWASRSEALVQDSDGLWLWDFATGQRSMLRPAGQYQVSSAPGAGVWAVASWAEASGGRVRIGKWGRKQMTLLIQSKESFLGLRTVLQISRNGARLVAPVYRNGCSVFDLADGRVVWQREKLELGAQACLSPSGQRLFLCSLMGTLEIIDLDGGESVRRSLPQPGQTAVLFPLEEDCVLVQRGEDTMALNWRTNTTGAVFRGRPSSISDDGRWMVTESGRRKLNLWMLPETRRVATFTSDSPILHTALSPDGRFLIAGDQRGGVYILQKV